MHYRLGRELKALSKIFTLIGILVNAFLLYFYLGNNYLLSRKIYYAVIFVFLMILVWIFGKAINGIGVMLTTQGKMLHEPKIEEPENEKSIKSTFLAFCHVFKKNKKVFVSLIVVCVILLGGGIYAKVNYDINHAYDGIWNIEGDLEGNYFDIRGDDVAFFETNRGEEKRKSEYKCIYAGSRTNNDVNFYCQTYDYTSTYDYKSKEIEQTIHLNRTNNNELEVNGKKYVVRELASQEMKNSAGATWDAGTASNAISAWASALGDSIDIVISNNDGMGMAMFNSWSQENGVPTFGYDANADAVAAIADGYGGTISQHADVQAYLTLRVIRNALDGVDIDTGIGTADDAGNCLTEGEDYRYSEEDRSYYALNVAVTADNYKDFTDSTKVYDKVSKQLDSSKSPSKKVWLDIYNASDNFLSSTYQPLLENYDDLLNLTVDYIGGDGQTESNITNRLGNPSEYDAFAINMVKTDNASSYTSLLK